LPGIWRTTKEPVEVTAGNDLPGVSPLGNPRGSSADRLAERVAVAVAGFLGRYKGQTRVHTASDLRVFLSWCAERGLDPLDPAQVGRVQVEAFVRWMQETRRFQPSTVSRRVSVVAGFYRTAVIDGLVARSPIEHVRRPRVPAESPTLGLSHLQFEAMLVAARQSANAGDFALVCFLGLLGLRIFEAVGSDIADLGEEHGHRVLRVVGKGGRVVLVPLPPAVARAVERAVGGRVSGPILLNRAGRRMDRHAATRRLHRLADTAGVRMPRMHLLRQCLTQQSIFVMCRSRLGTQILVPRCATTVPGRISTGTPTTGSPLSWPQVPEDPVQDGADRTTLPN
jgi:integrase/recombinase XerD